MAKILITGGTGSIGKHLIKRLIELGHKPVVLSRRANKNLGYETFKWDPENGYIDDEALRGIEHIINLAGCGIADKRWTKRSKAEIVNSRVSSAKVLYTYLKRLNIKPLSFIGASAIGYYGMQTNEKVYEEKDAASTDFLGSTCRVWEESYAPLRELAHSVSIVRIGIVLARTGGVYAKMLGPVKMNLGLILGSGKQYTPWIHVEDLVNVFTELISGKISSGTYNAVASQHITNAYFTKTLASSLHRTFFLPRMPRLILKLVLGEMSCLLIEGSRVSNQKLISAGFRFKYNDVETALLDLAKE